MKDAILTSDTKMAQLLEMQDTLDFLPLVSIVIPVYNGSNYMREAIDSALSQTYDNIEVIVVNDGSTDDTEAIALSYGDRIRYYAKENGGVASALNLAIREAKGEYISWLSHDDIYYLEKIERQVAVLSGLNADNKLNTILASNYALINEHSKVTHSQKFHDEHDGVKLKYPLYLLFKGLVHGCTLLIPKQAFENGRCFDETLKTTQDYDLWFTMFQDYNVVFLPDLLVKSRWHSEQGSKTISAASAEADALWIKMMRCTTDEQKCAIDNGVLSFYKKTNEIVSNAGYIGASKFAKMKIDELKNVATSAILVSIIIPFHNRVKWTVEAIRSAINQSHKNIEILLVNDGTTDDISPVYEILREDKRITLIDNRRTKGVSGARNSGIDIARGAYIAFLDSDDVFAREKIEEQLLFMVRNGLDFTHTAYETFTNETSVSGASITQIRDYTYPSIVAGCSIATPTVMINAELLSNAGKRFPENYTLGEDICFWIKLTNSSACIGLSTVLTKVRIHDSNTATDDLKQIAGIRNILNFVFDNYLDASTIPYITRLNALLFYHIEKAFLLCKPQSYRPSKGSVVIIWIFQKVRSFIRNILFIKFWKHSFTNHISSIIKTTPFLLKGFTLIKKATLKFVHMVIKIFVRLEKHIDNVFE